MELVILIGLQASGKSTFRRAYFSGTHTCISKDDFPKARNRSRRQRRLLADALEKGQSVVVDNTNPTVEARAELITVGKEFGATIIGYYFESQVAECLERNRRREGMARVPDVAIFSTIKKLQRPAYDEGFAQLFHVRQTSDWRFEISEWIDEGP